MKRFVYAGLCALAVLSAASCRSTHKELATEVFSTEDSTEYARLKINVELPVVAEGAAAETRRTLIGVMDEQLSRICSFENTRHFPGFENPDAGNEEIVEYYRKMALSTIGRLSQSDVDERASYLENDPDISPERKAEILAEIPGWEYEFNLQKTEDTERYTVFQNNDYVYMGGAHGGITGFGCLTFDKKDGQLVDPILRPDCTEEMQPLLVKGLLSYYKDAGVTLTEDELKGQLFIENGIIPLPTWPPYPSEDGLHFVYKQYEIASYAEGMPGFVLGFDEVKPFLTDGAKAVLGL